MSKNKNKKKYVSNEKEHITISFCNKITKDFKKLLGDNSNLLFEELHKLHIDGKNNRSKLLYLTLAELKTYVLEKNPNTEKIINEPNTNNIIFDFLAALEWKQFYQIYRFNPELVKNLWDIDYDIRSYDAFEFSEMQFLPCYSFYIEQEVEYAGTIFPGFFCRFNTDNDFNFPMLYITLINNGYFNKGLTAAAFDIPFNSVIAQIEVDFNDGKEKDIKLKNLLPNIEENKIGATIEVAEISDASDELVFKIDIYEDVEIDNGKVITYARVSPLLYLFIQNRDIFSENSIVKSKSLFETTIKITQLINYLIASNVDMTLTKKPDRKPYLQREHFNNADFCVWGLGNRLQHNKLNSGKTSNIKTEDTITIPLNDEELVNERKRYVQNKDADVLYHIDNGLEEVSENKAKRERTKEHNRPHMRKAHWTHYWYGKKDGSEERVRRRKFVSAVFVNATNEDVDIPTREEITYYRFRD